MDDAGRLTVNYDPQIAASIQGKKLKPTSVIAKLLYRRLARNRPTLLIRGANSDIVGAEEASYMRKAAPGLQYAEVPGIGHAPMLTEPAAQAALASFLANVP
jgi:pimeloyl-ACP methyl ester carboxylesterase